MDKHSLYEQISHEIFSVLEGEEHPVAQMATVSCLLAQAFPKNIWTGFYLVDPEKPTELVVGPYQGTLGCLRIPFAKGVCGAAARTGESQIVADVREFSGHIACDANSVSEIVIPVRNKAGALIAVLDIDSPEVGTFDAADQTALEHIIAKVFTKSSRS